MTRIHQPVPQIKRRRSQFVDLGPRRAMSAGQRTGELLELCRDSERSDAFASTLVCVALPDADLVRRRAQQRLTPGEFARLDPVTLRETRRPPNPKTRRARHVWNTVKPQGGGNYQVILESHGEQAVAWELLIGRPERVYVTQCVALRWADERLTLDHTPDLLVFDRDGLRYLVDVTSTARVTSTPEGVRVVVRAPNATLTVPLERAVQWELTARFAERLGWRYEVRLPASAQAATNLRTFDHWASPNQPSVLALARQILTQVPAEGMSLGRLLRQNAGPVPPGEAVKHLVQNGMLFCDWTREVRRTTWLWPAPIPVESGGLVRREAWQCGLTEAACVPV